MQPENSPTAQDNTPPVPLNDTNVLQPPNPSEPEIMPSSQPSQEIIQTNPVNTSENIATQVSAGNHKTSVPVQQPYSVPSISANPSINQEPSKKRLTIDTLVVLLLIMFGGIGPGSIIAGLCLIIKSFIKHDKAIRRTATALILAGIIVTGFFYYLFIASKSVKVQVGSVTVHLELPAGNKVIEQQSDYIIYGVPAKGSSELYVGQIILSSDSPISASQAEQQMQSSEFKSAVKSKITFCPNSHIADAKKIQIEGAQTAYQIDFKCPKQSDGSEFVGYIVTALTPEQSTQIVVAAEHELFQVNQLQWENVIPSIKIEPK